MKVDTAGYGWRSLPSIMLDSGQLAGLEAKYRGSLPRIDRFRNVLVRELQELLNTAGIQLSVPIQHRTKTWISTLEKIETRYSHVETPLALQDLAGLRLILQFRRDTDAVCNLIAGAFVIVAREDVSSRLTENQFGYSSIHFVIKAPTSWSAVPSTAGLDDLSAEIQVRTTAQHIWASASHLLQYKREESVPFQLRRSLYRVSALLETVDLEFERLLDQREQYIAAIQQQPLRAGDRLDVEILKKILDLSLPRENRVDMEDYGGILRRLAAMAITTVGELKELIAEYLPQLLIRDHERAAAVIAAWKESGRPPMFPAYVQTSEGVISVTRPSHIDKGLYYTHTGFVDRILWWKQEPAEGGQGGEEARLA